VDAQLVRDRRKMYVYVFANSYRKIAAISRYVIRRFDFYISLSLYIIVRIDARARVEPSVPFSARNARNVGYGVVYDER